MNGWVWLILLMAIAGCRDGEPTAAGLSAPFAVAKANHLTVLAHFMPRFDTLQHDGASGHHLNDGQRTVVDDRRRVPVAGPGPRTGSSGSAAITTAISKIEERCPKNMRTSRL